MGNDPERHLAVGQPPEAIPSRRSAANYRENRSPNEESMALLPQFHGNRAQLLERFELAANLLEILRGLLLLPVSNVIRCRFGHSPRPYSATNLRATGAAGPHRISRKGKQVCCPSRQGAVLSYGHRKALMRHGRKQIRADARSRSVVASKI